MNAKSQTPRPEKDVPDPLFHAANAEKQTGVTGAPREALSAPHRSHWRAPAHVPSPGARRGHSDRPDEMNWTGSERGRKPPYPTSEALHRGGFIALHRRGGTSRRSGAAPSCATSPARGNETTGPRETRH